MEVPKKLFRGKSELTGEWAYGHLVEVNDKYCIISDKDFDLDGHHIMMISDFPIIVNKKTIGIFTGKKDKNSKSIYSGDILKGKYFNTLMIVEYSKEKAGFFMYDLGLNEFCPIASEDISSDFEIVGNIYDNRNLFE